MGAAAVTPSPKTRADRTTPPTHTRVQVAGVQLLPAHDGGTVLCRLMLEGDSSSEDLAATLDEVLEEFEGSAKRSNQKSRRTSWVRLLERVRASELVVFWCDGTAVRSDSLPDEIWRTLERFGAGEEGVLGESCVVVAGDLASQQEIVREWMLGKLEPNRKPGPALGSGEAASLPDLDVIVEQHERRLKAMQKLEKTVARLGKRGEHERACATFAEARQQLGLNDIQPAFEAYRSAVQVKISKTMVEQWDEGQRNELAGRLNDVAAALSAYLENGGRVGRLKVGSGSSDTLKFVLRVQRPKLTERTLGLDLPSLSLVPMPAPTRKVKAPS